MTVFEPTIGVAEFARMIRDAGGSMSNEKLLGIAECGAFAGYHIYLYRGEAGSIEGYIAKADAMRWIEDHSIETEIRADMLAYAQAREESA